MIESILISVRKQIGLDENCPDFDSDLIMHINSAFLNLKQIGVGPDEGYAIEGVDEKWNDYINTEQNPESKVLLSAVKTYIYVKVKLIFDPPQSSAVIELLKQSLAEAEWRLNLEAESKQYNSGSTNKPIVEDGWCILVARE